jgi:hypothetical protein
VHDDDEEGFSHENAAADGWVTVACPHCGESVGIQLDPESRGEMVQDCEVCCNPWLLTVEWTREGVPRVRVEAM